MKTIVIEKPSIGTIDVMEYLKDNPDYSGSLEITDTSKRHTVYVTPATERDLIPLRWHLPSLDKWFTYKDMKRFCVISGWLFIVYIDKKYYWLTF